MQDPIGDYIKKQEAVWDFRVPSKTPLIIRLDGNNFSSLTSCCTKPFDERFRDCMVAASLKVLNYCSDAVVGYTQSDEASFLLLPTQSEFLSGRIQKIVSLVTGVMVGWFGVFWRNRFGRDDVPNFDGRVFTIHPDKVNEYFAWRQADAFKNCISTTLYWKKRENAGKVETCGSMDKVSTKERIELLHKHYGINASDLPVWQRRGMFMYRKRELRKVQELMKPEVWDKLLSAGQVKVGQEVERFPWVVDYEPPRVNREPKFLAGITEAHKERTNGKIRQTQEN